MKVASFILLTRKFFTLDMNSQYLIYTTFQVIKTMYPLTLFSLVYILSLEVEMRSKEHL